MSKGLHRLGAELLPCLGLLAERLELVTHLFFEHLESVLGVEIFNAEYGADCHQNGVIAEDLLLRTEGCG